MTEEAQPGKPEKARSEQHRVSKREFLARVAAESDLPLRTVNLVYDTILDELLETMRRGDALMLTGFGKFYPQSHAGHRVQFADGGGKVIDDYFVLKFSATRAVNRSLLEAPREERAEIGELFSSELDEAEMDEAEMELESRPTALRRKKADQELVKAAEATRSQRVAKRVRTTKAKKAEQAPEQSEQGSAAEQAS